MNKIHLLSRSILLYADDDAVVVSSCRPDPDEADSSLTTSYSLARSE